MDRSWMKASRISDEYENGVLVLKDMLLKKLLSFVPQYIETVQSIGLLETRHDQTRGGKGTQGYNVVTMT